MPLVLALLFLLVGCAAPHAKAAGMPAKPPVERLHYRASVPVVPASASSVVLSVRIESAALADALPVEARVLVGNGLLECPLASPAERTTSFASLSWAAEKTGARELRLETHGKPFELVVELARAPQSDAPDALEHALVLGTSALVDGKPFEGVVTHLERAH